MSAEQGELTQYAEPVLFILFKAGIVANEASMITLCAFEFFKRCVRQNHLKVG